MSSVTTKTVDGANELGNQIARLMAALTRAGQGNSPSSTPNSPRHRGHGRGRTDRNTSSHPKSYNGQTGLGQAASAPQVICWLQNRDHRSKPGECPRVQRWPGKHFKQKGPQLTTVFQMSRLGPHGSGACHPSQVIKPDQGEPMECSSTPHQQQSTVKLQHSLPDLNQN